MITTIVRVMMRPDDNHDNTNSNTDTDYCNSDIIVNITILKMIIRWCYLHFTSRENRKCKASLAKV